MYGMTVFCMLGRCNYVMCVKAVNCVVGRCTVFYGGYLCGRAVCCVFKRCNVC